MPRLASVRLQKLNLNYTDFKTLTQRLGEGWGRADKVSVSFKNPLKMPATSKDSASGM